jgi:acetyl esterase/lipase
VVAGTLFLVAAAIGAFHTMLALGGPRRPAWLSFALFFGGWMAGDLAFWHIGWQLAATAAFVAFGALETPAGAIALAITLVSWAGLVVAHRRHRVAEAALEDALREALGDGYADAIFPEYAQTLRRHVPARELLRPFRPRVPGVVAVRNVPYGEHRRQRLDVVKPAEPVSGAPVLLQVHGGGWVSGRKHQQGQPLMHYLASRGWVCVAIEYRLAPSARFPAQLIDCKRALAWIRSHVAEHGGDPDFVIVTGGSAGGHLAALMGLTHGDPVYQPGFEEVDTTVDAAIPLYGVYDFRDRHGVRGRAAMTPFLERMVMPTRLSEDPEGWEAASPIARVRADAPPFFVIHGAYDSLVWVEDARHFVAALRAVSRNPVVYAEIPYAQHAFDVMTTIRTVHTVNAIARFCEWVRTERGHGLGRPRAGEPRIGERATT